MIPAFPVIDFPGLPGTAPATQPSAAPAQLDGPLATRFPWRLTIAGKAEYYDAAATNYLPQSLSEAIVLLYICAHPTEHMWQARSPEHEDGVDSALPLGMDPVGLRKSIALWAARSLRHDEDAEVMALALQLWVDGHATFATPTDGSAQKKNGSAPHWTESYINLLTDGDPARRDYVLHRMPLRDAHAAMHARFHAAGIDCVTSAQRAARAAAVDAQLAALNL